MTTEGKVSPLPWYAVGDMVIDADGNAVINECDTDEAASLVVRAVNAHDRLVAALELILHSFDDGPPSLQSIRLDDACESARELLDALAAAKEG